MLKKMFGEWASAVLIVSMLFLVSCPDNNGTSSISGSKPENYEPVRIVYLDDEYNLSTVDSARMTAMLVDNDTTYPIITAEETEEGDFMVRFASLDRESFPDSVSIGWYFGKNEFPHLLVTEEDGKRTFWEITPYDALNESFGLVEDGVVTTYTLNKEIFDAYVFDQDLTQSQNIRLRNMYTAIAIASVIEMQEQGLVASAGYYMILAGGKKDKNPLNIFFKAVAVVAIAVIVVTCPVVYLAAPATGAGIGIATYTLATTESIAAATVLVGAVIGAVLTESSEKLPKDESAIPPPEIPLRTGQPGPEGGMIIDRRHNPDVLKYDLEIIPVDRTAPLLPDRAYPEDMPPYGPVNYTEAVSYYENETWRLPSQEELRVIYSLYLLEELFPLEKMSPIITGFLWTSTESGTNSVWTLDLSIKQKDRDKFGENFSSNSKNNVYSVMLVRELPDTSPSISGSGI